VGPGAGEEGGRIVVSGEPETVALAEDSRTASYLRAVFDARSKRPPLKKSNTGSADR
jgi:excinuclease UvrABC ATPase subunit